MNKIANFSIRTDEKKREGLERIAKSQDRSLNYVVNEAIEAYLDYWDWSVEHISQGLEEAKRGEGSDHDQVFAKLEKKLKSKSADL